jgi:hypothetical protein
MWEKEVLTANKIEDNINELTAMTEKYFEISSIQPSP